MVINNKMKNDEVEELSSAMVQQSKQLDQSELFVNLSLFRLLILLKSSNYSFLGKIVDI